MPDDRHGWIGTEIVKTRLGDDEFETGTRPARPSTGCSSSGCSRSGSVSESSRTYLNDRLPLASLGRVEGGDGIVEGRDMADVRPQPSVTHPLYEVTQL